jgi:hypothetical protein
MRYLTKKTSTYPKPEKKIKSDYFRNLTRNEFGGNKVSCPKNIIWPVCPKELHVRLVGRFSVSPPISRSDSAQAEFVA